MDNQESNKSSVSLEEPLPKEDEQKPETKVEVEPNPELVELHREYNFIKKKLAQFSRVLESTPNVKYCSVDGLHSGLPLEKDENGFVKDQGEPLPNGHVVQKFGQDYHSESVIPAYYTWHLGDGSIIRYVIDFVMYTSRGDKFVPLDHLGRYESKIIMYCKVKHVGLVHTAEEIIENEHPWMETFKYRRKVDSLEGILKVPRKQRFFSSKVIIVDWFFDVGTTEDVPPYMWVVSENDVYYRIDRPSGGYYNTFVSTKLLFDISTRVVKEMQSGRDKSFRDVVTSMTKPAKNYNPNEFNPLNVPRVINRTEPLPPHIQPFYQAYDYDIDNEELTNWGAPLFIHGSTMVDVCRNLDFIVNECRYYYSMFGQPTVERYLTELLDTLKGHSPFHYFDKNFIKMEMTGMNALASKYKEFLFLDPNECLDYSALFKAVRAQKRDKKSTKYKKFDLDLYNNQYKKNDVKSRSGRVIRNKAVEEVVPVVRKQVVQTESQKREEYRKAVELEAKCDGLLLPFDFEWSNYNTCSEASDTETTPVLCSDADVKLNDARYYPRDIPLRTLKFYGVDELVDLLDVTRQFSVPSSGEPPLLPRVTFVQLEANLLYTSSLSEFRSTEMSSFEVTSPVCMCNNKRFTNIHYWVGTSSLSHYLDGNDVSIPMEKNRDKCLTPADDEEFEDGLQWIYYLNKNLIDEFDIDYPEDLDEGSIGKLYTGLLQEFRRSIYNYGFDLFIKNLKDSEEVTEKKKEIQERELAIAISDADLAHDFLSTNGGCLYKGRFKRYGQDEGSVLPYVNGIRWNRRFKKFQRVVSVSSTYRYSTVSYDQDDDTFTVYDSRRPQNCPLDLLYGSEQLFKSVSSPGDLLPTYKAVVNVWKKEKAHFKKSPNMLAGSVNKFVSYLNKFSQGYNHSKKCLSKGMDIGQLDPDFFKDYLVDGTPDYSMEPILGYGYREADTLFKNEYLLAPDMISEYTWNTLLKIYLFYALYSFKAVYRFKLNSTVWGDAALINKHSNFVEFDNELGEGGEKEKKDGDKVGYNSDEEMIDTENLNMLDDMPYDDFSNSGAEEEEQSKEDDDMEFEKMDGDEMELDNELGEGGEKEHLARRGWGLNRYCPYYEFEMEWHPDQERFESLSKGKVNMSFVKAAFVKLKQRSFFQLDVYERLNLLLWLADILSYSNTGRNYLEKRNEEFYQLRTQLMRAEDEKKGIKRVKVATKELQELEERYRQKPVLLGHDRFFNAYYYFGLDYDKRIYVQTMPQARFVQNRIARRMRFIKVPSFKPCSFNLNLFEFAQKFTQDRIFNQPKGKRGRKRGQSKSDKEDPDGGEGVSKSKKRRSKKEEDNKDNSKDVKLEKEKVKGNEKSENEDKKMDGDEMELDRGYYKTEVKNENQGYGTLGDLNGMDLDRNRMDVKNMNNGLKKENMGGFDGNANRLDKGHGEGKQAEEGEKGEKGELGSEGTGSGGMNTMGVKGMSKDSSDSTPNSGSDNMAKKFDPMKIPSVRDFVYPNPNIENLSSSATPSNDMSSVGRDEESVKKKRGKGRTKNRPKVRRSRQVFDRHPTHFNTMEEYLDYLTHAPARISWCVIDSHKSLKRFIARLSQFTTNERNLAAKFTQIEPDFTLPAFDILTYKCPTVVGEMLLALLRGVYRYFKNEFSRMVLTTVVFKTENDHLADLPVMSSVDQENLTSSQDKNDSAESTPKSKESGSPVKEKENKKDKDKDKSREKEDKRKGKKKDSESNSSPRKDKKQSSKESKKKEVEKDKEDDSQEFKDKEKTGSLIYDKLYKSYNNGLFLNFLVNDIVKKCLTLCASDSDGCKKGLKLILELVYFFEFVANRFYRHPKWQGMRNEWKMHMETLYSQLVHDALVTRKAFPLKLSPKMVGEHNSSCIIYNSSGSPTNSGSCMISTPTGSVDLIVLVEKVGMWFRFFEVYVRDAEFEFGLDTYLNYRKVMDKYNAKLGGRDDESDSSQSQEDLRGVVDLLDFKEFRFDKVELYEFLNEMNPDDTLVYFSKAMKEAVDSVSNMYKKLQDLLGIKTEEEKEAVVVDKAASKPKKRKKKKDKDAESDCNVTDLDSNFDPSDMYQVAVSQDRNSNEEKDSKDNDEQLEGKEENKENNDNESPEFMDDVMKLLDDDGLEQKESKKKEVDKNKEEEKGDEKDSDRSKEEKEDNNKDGMKSDNGEKKLEDSSVEGTKEKGEKGELGSEGIEEDDSQEFKDKEKTKDKSKKENKKDKDEKNKPNSPKEEVQVADEEESANEMDGQKDEQNKEKKVKEDEKLEKDKEEAEKENHEELIEDVKLLMTRLEKMYENAPKETCEVNVLSLTTNLIHVKLPSNSEGSVSDDSGDKESSYDEGEPDVLILCLNLTLRSLGCDEVKEEDEDDMELSKKSRLLTNLRRLTRAMSKVERTRATKKVSEEKGSMPRTNEAKEPKEFKITVPLVLKSPFEMEVPQCLYTYQKVFDGLSKSWRSSMKCVSVETGQQGVVKRANYSSQDVWKCIGVEWSDNKKEVVMLNPWELTS